MPLTFRSLSSFLTALIFAFGLAIPAHAVDPALKKVIAAVSFALGEPALNDALPLIECIIAKGPLACVDVKGIAESEGKQAVKQYLPDDPKIKATVEIIKAAYANDYLKVLELGGVKLLPPLSCGVVIQLPGPVKQLVCNKTLFGLVANVSGPAFKQLITTVKNPSLGNLWSLVTVMDAKLACDVVEKTLGDVPGLAEVCGPFGEVIELAKKTVEQAAKAGKAAGEFLLDTGEDIINGVGGALEGACKGIGLCDSDGKKLMSADEYYKYRLFPWVHDRVVLRLAQGQQNLGHDQASGKVCLSYYLYDFYKSMAPSLADKVKMACDNLGARLHKDADALAKAFAAAPGPYFDSGVKSLIPTLAVEGYSQNKSADYRKFIVSTCLPNMRKTFPIPEPIGKGLTAWDLTCNKIGGLFTTAYQAEEQKLTGIIQKLVAGGCFPPAGWNATQGIKLQCNSYPGYQECLQALSSGLEQKHCSVDHQKADTKLAKAIAAELGSKRCRAEGTNVICGRPWKEKKCAALRTLMSAGVEGSQVQCKGDAVMLAGFLVLSQQAAQIVKTLNGASGSKEAPATTQGTAGSWKPGTGNCRSTWDPLAITCQQPDKLSEHPEINLPACPTDPNQDGADQPCYDGPISWKMTKEAMEKAEMKQVPLLPPLESGAGSGSRAEPAQLKRGLDMPAVQTGRAAPAPAIPVVPVPPSRTPPAIRSAVPMRPVAPALPNRTMPADPSRMPAIPMAPALPGRTPPTTPSVSPMVPAAPTLPSRTAPATPSGVPVLPMAPALPGRAQPSAPVGTPVPPVTPALPGRSALPPPTPAASGREQLPRAMPQVAPIAPVPLPAPMGSVRSAPR